METQQFSEQKCDRGDQYEKHFKLFGKSIFIRTTVYIRQNVYFQLN